MRNVHRTHTPEIPHRRKHPEALRSHGKHPSWYAPIKPVKHHTLNLDGRNHPLNPKASKTPIGENTLEVPTQSG